MLDCESGSVLSADYCAVALVFASMKLIGHKGRFWHCWKTFCRYRTQTSNSSAIWWPQACANHMINGTYRYCNVSWIRITPHPSYHCTELVAKSGSSLILSLIKCTGSNLVYHYAHLSLRFRNRWSMSHCPRYILLNWSPWLFVPY